MKMTLLICSLFLLTQVKAQKLAKQYVNPTPGFSNVVSLTNGNVQTLFIAGQVGSGDTMEEQYRSSFRRVRSQLEDCGASFSDVVRMTIYIAEYDDSQLALIAQARKEIFGIGQMPAITMVGVDGLALPGMKVETEALAIVDLAAKPLTPAELKAAVIYKSIESTYGSEDSVFVLDLSGSQLDEIPNEVFDLPNLQRLNLSNTGIKSVSEKIGKLRRLQQLNLDHLGAPNLHLTTLPSNILKLTGLKEINLNGNPNLNYAKVFDQLSNLESLAILAIMGNGLQRLPENLVKLKPLEQVWLGQNPQLDVNQALDLLDELNNLQHLGFGGNGIPQLDFNQRSFERLENLWLAGNNIRSLIGIENLPKLKSVNLNGNSLSDLPGSLLKCAQLESLSLDNNPELTFKKLPRSMKELPNLRFLSLSNNDLKSLPENLEDLEKLQYLVVRQNPLAESEIRKFKENKPSLKILY